MKNLKYIILPFAFLFTLSFAQSETDVDPIEKARQAKEAADKAAAEAESLKEAAVEAAAQKAAKEAREAAKQKKEEEEARKLAEKEAAEEAELDAAAQAAADEAKRKMAAELGLELDEDGGSTADADTTGSDDASLASDTMATEEEHHVSGGSPLAGFSFGAAPSIGLLSGVSFTTIPVGATVVITTPWGFKLGPLDFTISAAFGGYTGKYDTAKDDTYDGEAQWIEEFNPTVMGVGGNLTLAGFIFAEGHAGIVGTGPGIRGFSGVSLEYLMKKGLNLPVNILIGGEGFITTSLTEDAGNTSGWGGLGVRLDYDF